MPRYCFHLVRPDHRVVHDPIGLIFPDDASAIEAARRILDPDATGRALGEYRVNVETQEGRPVGSIGYGAEAATTLKLS